MPIVPTWTLAAVGFVACFTFGAAFLRATATQVARQVTLSIVATTDVHGNVFPRNDRGGVALLAGYVNNLRAARTADGGGVVLLDAGDTFQGSIESNLSEGALVVDAYNAMGYDALAIGNHEFDFGSADKAGARQDPLDDPRGGVQSQAARAAFPFLAANLIDDRTNRAVTWPNVQPSAMIESAGIKVGLIGVMSIGALKSTLSANVHGLHVAPLVETIATEATALRRAGAQVIVVVAHAGGGCTDFDNPRDLTSCDTTAEIFQVAHALPPGLVNVIAAGHTHDGLGHIVDGTAIIQGYALGRSFARVDLSVDRSDGRVTSANPHAPREIAPNTTYEGRSVQADEAVVRAMAPALQRVRDLQSTSLGVVVDTPIRRAGDGESPLGNLFADAVRAGLGADVAIYTTTRIGMRADFAQGPLTFGALYDVFPFDNRVARITLTGVELRRLIADDVRRPRRGGLAVSGGALAVSGVRVRTSCAPDGLTVEVTRHDGKPIRDDEPLQLVTMDMLASGPFARAIAPSGGSEVPASAPILRQVVEDWLRERGGRLSEAQFTDPSGPRWEDPLASASACPVQ